jgi:cell division protein FtsQ
MVIAIILVGVIGYGAWMLVRSSVFKLEKIDVVGTSVVQRDAIIAASGLHVGENALKIDLHAVAARIRAVPGVADVRVQREGSLGIKITITERVAAVEVHSGDSVWFLDRSGILVDGAHRGSRAVPILQLSPSESFTSISTAEEVGVLAVWKRMPATLRSSLKSFAYQADGTLTFILGPTTVIFGTPDDIAAKIQAIQLVRSRVSEDHRRLARLDVRVPERPAARIS